MLVNLSKRFKYAFDGVRVVTYEPGEHELPENVGVIAVDNGYGEVAVVARKASPVVAKKATKKKGKK